MLSAPAGLPGARPAAEGAMPCAAGEARVGGGGGVAAAGSAASVRPDEEDGALPRADELPRAKADALPTLPPRERPRPELLAWARPRATRFLLRWERRATFCLRFSSWAERRRCISFTWSSVTLQAICEASPWRSCSTA